MTNGHDRAGLRLQPEVGVDLSRGIRQIVAAVRPTLGPNLRLVAVTRPNGGVPELLDSGATIARRIVALPDQAANTGAMLARAAIWQVHEAVGDGTATTAVIFERAVAEGLRYLAAGGDPWALREEIAAIAARIDAGLATMATPVRGKAHLTRLAKHLCHDDELAPLLGEILDVVGAEGQVDIHAAPGRHCDREYAEGMHWPGGVVSPLFITDQATRRVALTGCGIVNTDFDLSDPAEVRHILAQARTAGLAALVIIAQRLADTAIGALLTDPLPAFAVTTPGVGETGRMVGQQDLAVLTGAAMFSRAAGDTAYRIAPDGFGRARIAWADRDRFGLISGQGDPRLLRRHIVSLRESLRDHRSPDERERLRRRLGQLLGGSATLHIGGATAAEIEARKESASRAVLALRGALVDGVVPGGGFAYLACRDELARTMPAVTAEPARVALGLAMAALAAPARTILANSGYEPSAILTAWAGPGTGFDARAGRYVEIAAGGPQDSAAVSRAAVRVALAAAGQALTIDAVVSPRTPAMATTPIA